MTTWYTEYDADFHAWDYEDYWLNIEVSIRRVNVAMSQALGKLWPILQDGVQKIVDCTGTLFLEQTAMRTNRYPHRVARRGKRGAFVGRVAKLGRGRNL